MTLDPTHRAAGILFRAPNGEALFLKRGPGGDYPGYWCFPGGHIEKDETPEEAAIREAIEEVGFLPKGTREPLARSISLQEFAAAPATASSDGAVGTEALRGPVAPKVVDHTTFLQDVPKAFEPERDGEHIGHAWSPLTSPPEPLHPGCRVAIDRLFADELGVARMMAAEALTSPQVYKNVTLWAMRITGTGVSYRRPIFKTKDGKPVLDADEKPIVLREEEFPWRDPALYLNDEFLARCNGLPVIWQHPSKSMLDSKEHARRVVGSIFLPFVRGDEVWGIAKVYDDEANAEMRANKLSTSPAVMLSDPANPSYKFRLEDGSVLLVEGKPSLLDHLAICERGVWDKGGEAAGIDNHDLEETGMPEEIKADADKGPTLADVMAAIGSVALRVDNIGARVDAMEMTDSEKKDAEEKAEKEKADAEEKERKDAEDKEKADAAGDPERVAADKAKADAEEKDRKDAEDKEKADAACAKADADKLRADNKALQTRIDAIERKLPKDRADNDYNAMSNAQARADGVYAAFGEQAPRFLNGEEVIDYRRRLVDKFKVHSPAWEKVDLATLPDSAFAIAENAIYADAAVAAVTPSDLPDGGLRMVRGKTASGHTETKFYGRPSSWMSRFSGSRRYATAINPNPKREAV